MRSAVFLAFFLAFFPAAAQAQYYGNGDRTQDHRWRPAATGFNLNLGGMGNVQPGVPVAPTTGGTTVETNDPNGVWKYYFDGMFVGCFTPGSCQYYLNLRCMSASNVALPDANCPARPAVRASCVHNSLNHLSNCPSNVPVDFYSYSGVHRIDTNYNLAGTAPPNYETAEVLSFTKWNNYTEQTAPKGRAYGAPLFP